MEKVINVQGMTCGHCKNSVMQALGQLLGVSRIEVDLAEKRVVVEIDPTVVTEDQIQKAIEDIGFEVGGIR